MVAWSKLDVPSATVGPRPLPRNRLSKVSSGSMAKPTGESRDYVPADIVIATIFKGSIADSSAVVATQDSM